MTDVAAIVPYRADEQGFRRRNLGAVLRWLDEAGISVVLAEHSDSPDTELELSPNVTRIHIPAESRPFNKARACNAGFARGATAILCLVDADTIAPINAMHASIDAVRGELDVVRPYGRLIELDEEATRAICEGEPLPEAPPAARDDAREGERIPLCGGIVVIKSSAYLSVGGMDESFEGWGGEDDALSVSLTRAGKQCGILEQAAAFHLAHPRSMESRYGHPHYAGNLARARWWYEASDEEIAAQTRAQSKRLNSAV
jgi:GT2 family glycosyltransferase